MTADQLIQYNKKAIGILSGPYANDYQNSLRKVSAIEEDFGKNDKYMESVFGFSVLTLHGYDFRNEAFNADEFKSEIRQYCVKLPNNQIVTDKIEDRYDTTRNEYRWFIKPDVDTDALISLCVKHNIGIHLDYAQELA